MTTMSHRVSALWCLGFVLGTGACHFTTVGDDVSHSWGFLVGADDTVAPYAVGSTVRFTAQQWVEGDRKDWSVESTAPEVARVQGELREESDQSISFAVDMLKEGRSTIRIRGGEPLKPVIRSFAVEVAMPDRVEFRRKLDVRVVGAAVADVFTQGVMLKGTSTTILASFFKGNREVWAHHALTGAGADHVQVQRTSYDINGVSHDGLLLTSDQAGRVEIPLLVGGVPLDKFALEVVDEDAQQDIRFLTKGEATAKDGDNLPVGALALTAEGKPIMGSTFAWRLNEDQVAGSGDMAHYTFKPGQDANLRAATGLLNRRLAIHATGDLKITQSESCAHAPSATVLPFLGFLLAQALRRRVTRAA